MWYEMPGLTLPARPLLCLDDALLVQHSTEFRRVQIDQMMSYKKQQINTTKTNRVFEPGRLRLGDSLLLFPCQQQKRHPRL